MKPDEGKQLYGLIGYPVKHSYSPLMHNAAFQNFGLNAEYNLFEIPPQGLEEFFKKTIFEKNIRGFNVTVPHKEASLAFVTGRMHNSVKKIGAVNTVVVRSDRKLDAFNTDYAGFLKDLEVHGVSLEGKRIALLGAGGGAKAVAFALASQKPSMIRLFDIDMMKAEFLVKNIRVYFPDILAASSIDRLDIGQADILVNATPVGMKPEDPLLVDEGVLHPDLFVYDLIYNPAETKLLAAAKKKGCSCANGLGMLLHQGALAFEHWTGQLAPVDVMRQALERGIHG